MIKFISDDRLMLILSGALINGALTVFAKQPWFSIFGLALGLFLAIICWRDIGKKYGRQSETNN